MRREYFLVGVGLALGLLGVMALALLRPYQMRGSQIEPPVPAPDFTLSGTKGDFTLSSQQGSLVLIFFGYTTCPDICPSTLSSMKELVSRLGKDGERVKVVFITVDPQRDTIERIGQYAANFNPAFYGLSGSEEQLDPVWKTYGVYRNISDQANSAVGYLVDHSTQVYLVDSAGRLRVTYSFGTPVDNILSDVRFLLKE